MVDFSEWPLALGHVTVSPAAAQALIAARENVVGLLARHASGDWGAADDDDRAANWTAISGGGGLVCSVYRLAGGATVLVATEMAPRQTSVILATEA